MIPNISDFPTYQKCFDLVKDEDGAFRNFYWNAVRWHQTFREKLLQQKHNLLLQPKSKSRDAVLKSLDNILGEVTPKK